MAGAKAILSNLYLLAKASPLREVCGLVSSSGVIYPIRNIAESRLQFKLHRGDFAKAKKAIKDNLENVQCVYHSHPHGIAKPSDADLASIRECGFDYLIVTTNSFSYTEA